MRRFIASLICAVIAGLFYVSMEVEAVKTGYMIRQQEEMKVRHLDRGRALKYNIARLEAPHNLNANSWRRRYFWRLRRSGRPWFWSMAAGCVPTPKWPAL